MKVNVTIDCTPEEARRFMGLPDVQDFQNDMMEMMRDKIMDSMSMMEPEAAMKAWMPFINQGMTQGMNQSMDWFKSMMTGAAVNNTTTRKK